MDLSTLNLRSHHLWLDYDEEADVLYISLRKPQRATDSELEDALIYHYADHELVGVTILHAKASASHSPHSPDTPPNRS